MAISCKCQGVTGNDTSSVLIGVAVPLLAKAKLLVTDALQLLIIRYR